MVGVLMGAAPEHPRVGGEDASSWRPSRCMTGTPPRRRGGPWPPTARQGPVRNTPASAGRTASTGPPTSSAAEHPRVGGEDVAKRAMGPQSAGTPPRRRGGRPGTVRCGGGARNTPASAGRTATGETTCPTGPEHPRVGGEDISRSPVFWPSGGTPPRRRGGRQPEVLGDDADRNTPASAGRTPRWRRRRCCCSEHPRVGGEDPLKKVAALDADGTPPRRRGGLECSNRLVGGERNTPASAGRT